MTNGCACNGRRNKTAIATASRPARETRSRLRIRSFLLGLAHGPVGRIQAFEVARLRTENADRAQVGPAAGHGFSGEFARAGSELAAGAELGWRVRRLFEGCRTIGRT